MATPPPVVSGARSAAVLVVPLVLVLLVVVVAAAAVSGLPALTGSPGGPGPVAGADIPPDYLLLYQQAADNCPGLDWAVLAAIGKLETDHGRSTLPGVHTGHNSAGAGVISGSALVSRHVRVVGDTPRAGEVSAGCES